MTDNATLYVIIIPDDVSCVKAEPPSACIRELEHSRSGRNDRWLGARTQAGARLGQGRSMDRQTGLS